MISQRPLFAAAGCALLLTAAAGPAAADLVYSAVIDGATAGTTSAATGTVTMILNQAETEIAYEVVFAGLEGSETGAHFHNGAAGQIGARLQTLLPGSPKVGTWSVGPTEVAELNAGRIYINIHSSLFPTGEIRGNLEFTAVSAEPSSWGAVKALYR